MTDESFPFDSETWCLTFCFHMKTIEYKGNWWLPSSPSKRIGGILRFVQPDWPKLEIFGSFETEGDPTALDQIFIHGLSTSGKRITLWHPKWTASSGFSKGAISTTYGVDFIFVGAHF